MCLISKDGRGILHRVSPINDPYENAAKMEAICKVRPTGWQGGLPGCLDSWGVHFVHASLSLRQNDLKVVSWVALLSHCVFGNSFVLPDVYSD